MWVNMSYLPSLRLMCRDHLFYTRTDYTTESFAQKNIRKCTSEVLLPLSYICIVTDFKQTHKKFQLALLTSQIKSLQLILQSIGCRKTSKLTRCRRKHSTPGIWQQTYSKLIHMTRFHLLQIQQKDLKLCYYFFFSFTKVNRITLAPYPAAGLYLVLLQLVSLYQ